MIGSLIESVDKNFINAYVCANFGFKSSKVYSKNDNK